MLEQLRRRASLSVAASGFAAAMMVASPLASASDPGTSSTSVRTTARIIRGISLNCTTLDFGDILNRSGGTVTLDPSNGHRKADPTTMIVTYDDQGQAGKCWVSGEPNHKYNVTTDDHASLTNSSNWLTVDTFTLSGYSSPWFSSNDPGDDSGNGADANGRLNGSGDDVFTIGGTLHVDEGDSSGNYAGDFAVTVTYY